MFTYSKNKRRQKQILLAKKGTTRKPCVSISNPVRRHLHLFLDYLNIYLILIFFCSDTVRQYLTHLNLPIHPLGEMLDLCTQTTGCPTCGEPGGTGNQTTNLSVCRQRLPRVILVRIIAVSVAASVKLFQMIPS